MTGIGYIGGIQGLNTYNRPTNSKATAKTTAKCTDCVNCITLHCNLKKRKITSIFEARQCSEFKRVEFHSILKSK